MSNDESYNLETKLEQIDNDVVESRFDNQPFLNRGMKAVTIAQFFSALADNALLFVILALAASLNYPSWSEPIFQILFVAIYIVTAPFVGVFADAFDKSRVMMLSNGLKLVGAVMVCFGINPFVGYGLVALGAALYSPAKYGILGELNSDKFLVKANGLIEASTIAAILIGAILGGMLADHHIQLALIACALFYLTALVANIFIPKLVPMIAVNSWNPKNLFLSFIEAVLQLWKDREARISLLGTSLFWGAGITLRFLLIAWVPYVLGITNKTTPAILNAVVAIGIVLGAMLAAKLVPLKHALKAIPAGILMGIVVVITMWVKIDVSQLHSVQATLGEPSFAVIHQTLLPVHGLLLMIGALGGFFIVPLNALLQERGKRLVGVGKAIAIQNFSENSAMFAMLGIYFIFQKIGVSIVPLGMGFGVLFSFAIVIIWLFSSSIAFRAKRK